MKELKLKWCGVFPYARKHNVKSFNRQALCHPIIINSISGIQRMNLNKSFIIFDHQKFYGAQLGYLKEGIQLSFDGDKIDDKTLRFDDEYVFIPE